MKGDLSGILEATALLLYNLKVSADLKMKTKFQKCVTGNKANQKEESDIVPHDVGFQSIL